MGFLEKNHITIRPPCVLIKVLLKVFMWKWTGKNRLSGEFGTGGRMFEMEFECQACWQNTDPEANTQDNFLLGWIVKRIIITQNGGISKYLSQHFGRHVVGLEYFDLLN